MKGSFPIIGYENLYTIDVYGNIYSVKTGRLKSPHLTKKGYMQVELSSPEKKFLVHRLIAINFIPNPDNKPYVNHKNGVRNDNRIENLEWVTVSENNQTKQRKARRCPHCNEILYESDRLKSRDSVTP